MKKLTLLLSLFFSLASSAWASYKIDGKIISTSGQDTAGVNVVLIEQNPNKPPQGPIAMTKAGVGGVYHIEIDEADPASNYVVGTRLGQVRAASSPFKIDKNQLNIDVKVQGGRAMSPAQTDEVVAGPFLFAGRLKAEVGFDPDGTNVQLIEVTMSNPDGRVVSSTQSDAKGRYAIKLTSAAKHSLYFLAASKGARVAGSDPIPLKSGVKLPAMDLVFLPVSDDATNLWVEKNLYFFELMEDVVRVSEILLVENRFEGTLDLQSKPFSKKLPQGAENFELMRATGKMKAEEVNGKALVSVVLNPGRSQIFFSYDLPKSSFGKDLEAQLLPQTREVELVRTSEGFDIDFLGPLANNVVESKKGHGQELFFSKRSLVEGQETQFAFNIDVSLIPQKKLFYPATLLLVLLLSGLFWYVKVKPESK